MIGNYGIMKKKVQIRREILRGTDTYVYIWSKTQYTIRSGLYRLYLANKGEDCRVPLQIVSLSPYDQCVGRILNANSQSQSELTHSYYIANTDLEKFVCW